MYISIIVVWYIIIIIMTKWSSGSGGVVAGCLGSGANGTGSDPAVVQLPDQ